MGGSKRENIAIIGFMGAGKSTVGALLAARLRLEAVDLDEVIERRSGKSIGDIFAQEGEEGFREREHQALAGELERGERIISCGGGVVLRDDNMEMLREKCRVFYIEISPRVAAQRLHGEHGRPLLEGGELDVTVDNLMEERAERYLEAAHEVIQADELSPEEIAEEITVRWQKYRSGRREETTRST